MGDGADQIVDRRRRQRPVDAAVGGLAAAEVGAAGEIERDRAGGARGEGGQGAVEQAAGGAFEFPVEGVGGVLGGDGHRLLVHQVAGVGLGRHVMEAHPGLALAVDQRPVDRGAAAVAGEERAVEVEGAAAARASTSGAIIQRK